MEKQQPQTPPIPIELDEKAAEGIYSNFVLTAHTASEFVIDFARMLPGVNKAKVHARIVMTPQSAKALAQLLTRTVEKYEEIFGVIKIEPGKGGRGDFPPIGFQSGGSEDKH